MDPQLKEPISPEATPEVVAKNDVYFAEVDLANAKNVAEHSNAAIALMDANNRLALIQGKPGRKELEERADHAEPLALPEFLAEVEARRTRGEIVSHEGPLTFDEAAGLPPLTADEIAKRDRDIEAESHDYEMYGTDGVELSVLPLDSAGRKELPLYAGVIRYFPAALAAVARVSKFGNDKHNPGQPLHWSRGKSNDHADCIARHFIDMDEGTGVDVEGIPAVAYIAWRALALCQQWYEEAGLVPLAPGSNPKA